MNFQCKYFSEKEYSNSKTFNIFLNLSIKTGPMTVYVHMAYETRKYSLVKEVTDRGIVPSKVNSSNVDGSKKLDFLHLPKTILD